VLPDRDVAHLVDKRLNYDLIEDGGMLCVLLPDYPLPEGYEPRATTLLLRLPPGYPDAAPDMYWCDPPVRLAAGGVLPAADSFESYLGRSWQRFSRHLQSGAWRAGSDGLASYLSLIRADMERNA
jgi:hypothetical protein